MKYWLLKTEPSTYSFSQLITDKKTNWDHVRNYQARNNLKKMSVGDQAFIYHSGDEKAVVGTAKIIRAAYPDPDPEGGDWVQVDIQCIQPLKQQVSLAEIKNNKDLAHLPLIKQSRLSVMEVSAHDFKLILKLGKS